MQPEKSRGSPESLNSTIYSYFLLFRHGSPASQQDCFSGSIYVSALSRSYLLSCRLCIPSLTTVGIQRSTLSGIFSFNNDYVLNYLGVCSKFNPIHTLPSLFLGTVSRHTLITRVIEYPYTPRSVAPRNGCTSSHFGFYGWLGNANYMNSMPNNKATFKWMLLNDKITLLLFE